MNFSILLALGIYIAILAVITYYSAKRESPDDFLIGSRKMGWVAIGLSVFATLISSYNLVVGLTFGYLFGVYLILAFAGAILAFIGVYFIFLKNRGEFVKRNFINVIDYFEYKFGSRTAKLLNLTFIFILFFFIVLQLYVNTFVFSNLMGWNKYISSIFVAAIVLAYTYLGGFKTDVKTDIFQGIFMFALVILVFLVDISPITSTAIYENIADKAILVGAISLAIMQFLTLLVQPELWQRAYSAKSNKDLKKGFILAFGLLLLILVPEVIIGMAAKYGGQITNAGNAFYEIMKFAAPSWLFPLIIVALFAAFMSTLDSSLFAISSQLGKQGILRHQKETDAIKIKNNVRIAMVIVTLIALVFSLFIADFLGALFQLISIATVAATVVMMSFLLKVSQKESFIALIIGIIAYVVASFGGVITQDFHTALYPSIFVAVYMLVQKIAVSLHARSL